MNHLEEVAEAFMRACKITRQKGISFRPMQRRSAVKDLKRSYTLGHANLKTRTITVDIFTAKRRNIKKMSAILSVVAHELAHYRKPPYRQRHRGRIINRIHFPIFYRQCNRNLKKFKKDKILGGYFEKKKARGGL